MKDKIKKILTEGIEALNLTLSEEKQEKLLLYITEFEKWNRAYNLSSVRSIDKMVERHLLDSLSVAPHIMGTRLADVGTGGGLPGVPLAIIFPEKKFTLIDSNGKKTRFIFHIKNLLHLENLEVFNVRVESYKPEIKFDAVISRAFASLKDMTDNCAHLLTPQGVFLAMKGIYPKGELNDISAHYRLQKSTQLQVPGDPAERHLLCIVPNSQV